MNLHRRSFLNLTDFTPAEIAGLLDLAAELKAAKKEYANKKIKPLKAYIKSMTDEKDAHYKAVAQSNLAQRMKDKAEVIKKDSKKVSVKIEFEAEVANSPVYLPDIDEAIKSLEV